MKLNFYLTLLLAFCVSVAGAQVLQEDFEAGVPDGWTFDGGWEHGDAASVSSQYFNPPDHTKFMAVNDDGAGNDRLDKSALS